MEVRGGDSFRGMHTLKSQPRGIQKSPFVYPLPLVFTNKPHHHITVIKQVQSYIAAPTTTPPPPKKRNILDLFLENLLDYQR